VKVAGVFASDDQAVHGIVREVVHSNQPRDAIDLGCPWVSRIVGRCPGDLARQLFAQFRRGMRQPFLLVAILDFPGRWSVAVQLTPTSWPTCEFVPKEL
jgi:hypothetical protein